MSNIIIKTDDAHLYQDSDKLILLSRAKDYVTKGV